MKWLKKNYYLFPSHLSIYYCYLFLGHIHSGLWIFGWGSLLVQIIHFLIVCGWVDMKEVLAEGLAIWDTTWVNFRLNSSTFVILLKRHECNSLSLFCFTIGHLSYDLVTSMVDQISVWEVIYSAVHLSHNNCGFYQFWQNPIIRIFLSL